MSFFSNFEISSPIASFSIYNFIFPFTSIIPYFPSLCASYIPASLSIRFRLSYNICTFIVPSLEIIPTFPLLFAKKSPVSGIYVISSYFGSIIVFPFKSITPSCFLSFCTTSLSSNIDFSLWNSLLISANPLSSTVCW